MHSFPLPAEIGTEPPEGEGWTFVLNEEDAIRRFPNYPSVEIVANGCGKEYGDINEILAFFGLNSQYLFGIGGWIHPGVGRVYNLGRRGGAWMRVVEHPKWTECDDGDRDRRDNFIRSYWDVL